MSASSAPTARFRLLWAGATLLAWAALAALALHRSADPALFGRYSLPYAKLLSVGLVACTGLTVANLPLLLAWIQTRWRELVLLPLSASVALLGAEIFVRLFDPLGISYYTEIARYAKDRVPAAAFHYHHPRSTTRRYQDVEVRYNELGLRDDPVAPKAENEWRILVLGDSIVFGWGVEQEKTFAPVLQRRLAEELARPVRVLNTGVCSYNTVMQLAWLREHGFALEPDLVLLVYVPNDVVPAERTWTQPSAGPEPDPPFTDALMSQLRRARLFRLIAHARQQETLQVVPGRPGDAGWEASMDSLRALLAESRARDLDVAAYLWTWKVDARHAELLAATREALAPVSVEESARWFEGEEPVQRWFNSVVDHHPNADAHAVTARRIHESLRAQGLLPDASSTRIQAR